MSIRVSARVVEREARVFSKLWRGSIFSSFGTPVLYLSAMGLGLGGIIDARNRSVGGLSYLAFVTPGLMAAGAAMSTTGESLWPVLSGFKWMRHYHAMSAAAPRPRDIYDGAVAWLGCHAALSSAAFLVVAAVSVRWPSICRSSANVSRASRLSSMMRM